MTGKNLDQLVGTGAAIALVLIFASSCPPKKTPDPEPSPSCYTNAQGVRECGLQTGVQPGETK